MVTREGNESMEAVINHESRPRIRTLVVAVATSVAIAGLIGVGAYTGVLPAKQVPLQDALTRSDLKPAPQSTCALCGTIESVRTVEVYDEPSSATGGADPKNGAEAIGPGGWIGGDANARKRLVWRVTLRMDDGSFRTISMPSPPAFAVGDKVRVIEGRLVRT
jgi:hypothetical protein